MLSCHFRFNIFPFICSAGAAVALIIPGEVTAQLCSLCECPALFAPVCGFRPIGFEYRTFSSLCVLKCANKCEKYSEYPEYSKQTLRNYDLYSGQLSVLDHVTQQYFRLLVGFLFAVSVKSFINDHRF